MKDAIARLNTVFRDYAHGNAQNQPRRRLKLETGAVLHSLAGSWGDYFGTKVYSTHPRLGAWFTVLLYEAKTAKPLAQFEANWLGQIRTGAISGVAADLLTPAGAVTVGCIGSGFQAKSQLQAIAAVRSISRVRVWSRDAGKRHAFADTMSAALETAVTAVDSAAMAVEGADIVVTATASRDPVLAAADIQEGCLILAMGSNSADRRELPGDLVTRSYVVVEDREACRIEAGDLLMALDERQWESTVELKDLLAREDLLAGRGKRTTVFKSVGLGLSDVAVASLIWERSETTPEQEPEDRHPARR